MQRLRTRSKEVLVSHDTEGPILPHHAHTWVPSTLGKLSFWSSIRAGFKRNTCIGVTLELGLTWDKTTFRYTNQTKTKTNKNRRRLSKSFLQLSHLIPPRLEIIIINFLSLFFSLFSPVFVSLLSILSDPRCC